MDLRLVAGLLVAAYGLLYAALLGIEWAALRWWPHDWPALRAGWAAACAAVLWVLPLARLARQQRKARNGRTDD